MALNNQFQNATAYTFMGIVFAGIFFDEFRKYLKENTVLAISLILFLGVQEIKNHITQVMTKNN